MSRFSRAYDAALSAEGISRSDAATAAGFHPSTLSRIMSDELGASVENIERLLKSLPRREDRLHCLREYLFDHAPQDYREELIIHFGAVSETRTQPPADPLREAVIALENAATGDRDLRRLLTDLARVVARAATTSEETNPVEAAAKTPGKSRRAGARGAKPAKS